MSIVGGDQGQAVGHRPCIITPYISVTYPTRQCLAQLICIWLAISSVLSGPLDSISMSVSTIAPIAPVDPEAVRYCVLAVIVQTADAKTHPFRSSPLSLFARNEIHPKKATQRAPRDSVNTSRGQHVCGRRRR